MTALILLLLTFAVNFVMNSVFWSVMCFLAAPFSETLARMSAEETQTLIVYLTVASILVPAVLAYMNGMQKSLAWSEGARPAQGEEYRRLDFIFSYVCRKANLPREDFTLCVVNSDAANAFSLGSRYIAVNRGMLAAFPDEEIAGILAHELGHIECGHTRYLLFNLGMNWFTNVTIIVYGILTTVVGLLAWIPFLGWVIVLVASGFNIFISILSRMLRIPLQLVTLFGSRQHEYEADAYACSIGLGYCLADGLRRIAGPTGPKKSGFLKTLGSTHPDIPDRLKHIQEEMRKQ